MRFLFTTCLLIYFLALLFALFEMGSQGTRELLSWPLLFANAQQNKLNKETEKKKEKGRTHSPRALFMIQSCPQLVSCEPMPVLPMIHALLPMATYSFCRQIPNQPSCASHKIRGRQEIGPFPSTMLSFNVNIGLNIHIWAEQILKLA